MSDLSHGFAAHDAELARIKNWGSERMPVKGQLSLQAITTAITLLPQVDFDERAAQDLVEAIQRRIEAARFAHRDHAVEAIESLGDAKYVLECAADDIRAEQEAIALEDRRGV